jgi:hypothetical protein
MPSLLFLFHSHEATPINLTILLIGAAILSFLIYVVYQIWFHPLASFPGPFWASITDLWQVHQFLSLKQPYNLTELHEKHGAFVRYGPDKLSVTAEDAITLIYQKGGRNMPKTEFYDAYGATTANVFGMRNEAVRQCICNYGPCRANIIRTVSFNPQASYVAQLLYWVCERYGAISRFEYPDLAR